MNTGSEKLLHIAGHFLLAGEPDKVESLGEGFINDTFLLTVKDRKLPRYILQRKNSHIFQDIPGMMNNIRNITSHLKRKILERGGDPDRESLTVVPTRDGKLYFLDGEEYWCVTLFIEDSVVYQKADTPKLAEQGGRGIGRFQAMLSDFDRPLADTLPGFHNIRFRFEQWDRSVAADKAGRLDSVRAEVAEIDRRRDEMLDFYRLIETGKIPLRVTHNDTKIANILFDRNDDVLCVLDLDTVLKAPCLYDFGDSIRSYTNTGSEDDPDTDRVSMSMDMYRAFLKGYLSQADSFLTDIERSYLPFSAKYITYEQVLRFLMDYIDGDTYYKIKYPEHNLVRTRAQIKLLHSIEESLHL